MPAVRGLRTVGAALVASWAIGCGSGPAPTRRASSAGGSAAGWVGGLGEAGSCAAGTYDPPAQGVVPAPRAAIRLNIPAFRLTASADGAAALSLPASVGAPDFPTPVGDFLVTDITWNPSWTPPDSEWAEGREPEPPGPDNPMGSVKMRFAPLLFVHGTPDTASIGTAASHGCVRLRDRDAVRLAEWLLAAGAPPPDTGVPRAGAETLEVRLQRPVRLAIVYETAELVDGFLLLHPDVYGRLPDPVRPALAVLEVAGIPASDRVRARLAAATPGPRGPSARIPLDSLRGEP